MSERSSAEKTVRRSATRAYLVLKPIFHKIWQGLSYLWERPLIISALLLILAIFLLNILIHQTGKPYTNCTYLLANKLAMPPFFCDGYEVKVLGSTIFTIPGLRVAMDPPLEFVRRIAAWGIVIFFAFLSLYITIILKNLKTIVKLLAFNKEEWKNFMVGLRTWLLIFTTFCLLFYFIGVR